MTTTKAAASGGGEKQPLLSRPKDATDSVPSPQELSRLLRETNFTEREILTIYRNASKYDESKQKYDLSKSEFAAQCFENGIKSAGLVERMWIVMDTDHSGGVDPSELVLALNPLLRGSRDDVARFFFDLYEIDGDGELSATEIISVYSDMLNTNTNQTETNTTLTSPQKARITRWVEQQRKKSSSGRLDKEAFVQAVQEMSEGNDNKKQSLTTPRNLVLIVLTSLFEIGASFTYFAVGAMADEFKERFDITDAGIGQLSSVYFLAAIVGPFFAGIAMDRIGPGLVNMAATFLILLGAIAQAVATTGGPSLFWLLIVGRFLLGLGGDSAPFLTVEMLGRIFPDYLGFMAGLRNLMQSTNGFLTFILLPMFADWYDSKTMTTTGNDEDADEHNGGGGTIFALWICVLLSFVSFAAVVIVMWMARKEKVAQADAANYCETEYDQMTVIRNIRSLSKATMPKMPDRWERFIMPPSFFFACIGIQAQYFVPLVFTAFSNRVYVEKFGTTDAFASLQTGLINLLAGLMGPFMGPLSDAVGRRAECLAFFTLLGATGCLTLAIGDTGETFVWIATVLFAIQYGFGDTVSYVSIRLIVGPSRAGIGYGLYGVIANIITFVVAIVGGNIMDQPEVGTTNISWYFFGLLLVGLLCWLVVWTLEGTRSLLELPNDDIIETSDDDLRIAALTTIVGGKRKSIIVPK